MLWTHRFGAGLGAVLLAALALEPAPAVSLSHAASRAATPGNGGLGWSGGFTAAQRLDRLDGAADDLPANVGPDAVFNETGDSILAYRGGTIYVLRATGIVTGYPARSVPPDLHAGVVAWAPDESYAVVAGLDGDESGVYRVAPGGSPVRLPDYFRGGVPRPTDDRLTFAQQVGQAHSALFTADPRHPEVAPVQISPTWCSYPCEVGETRVESVAPLSWDATGSRLLAGYSTVAGDHSVQHLGWFDPATGDFTDLPYDGSDARELFLSPDNTLLAYNYGQRGRERTKVVTVATGAEVADLSGHHWGWQPCPGACATFDDPVSPSRVPIGKASSGRKGGKPTATVRWRAPAHAGTTPVHHYLLQATPVGKPGGRHKRQTTRQASVRSYSWRLPRGRWKFRVCAYNTASPYCTISAYSNVVTAR